MRPIDAIAAIALLGLLAALAGCALHQPPAGDRLFAAGDFAGAKTAYEEVLDRGRAEGRRRQRALYHLGLIHARPDGAFHDPVKARRYLERLVAVRPASSYTRQAALVLELQLETARLRGETDDQRLAARRLLAELDQLRAEAEAIESAASGEQDRASLLARRLEELQSTLRQLTAELAAREEELERLKRIDLEDPP